MDDSDLVVLNLLVSESILICTEKKRNQRAKLIKKTIRWEAYPFSFFHNN